MLSRRAFGMMLAMSTCGIGSCGYAIAQSYPTRRIKLIVPAPPGGPSDALARLVTPTVSAALNETVIVDNRPGGGLTIGTRAAAAADADGYTLLLALPGPFTVRPAITKNLGYDPVKSFAAVALVARTPQVLVVAPSVPANSVRDLIRYAKINPGKLNLGIPGVGTQPHLIGELFKQRTDVNIVIVPFKGSATAMPDLLAGRIQMYFEPVPGVLPFIRAGKLRALAILSDKRHAELPDVPTMAEVGYDEFNVSFWGGIVAPAGTPASIVEKLNAVINAGVKSAEMRTNLAAFGAQPSPCTPSEFATFIASEMKKWAAVARSAGLNAE
jgi:tripartite-type tricarboxylate transporter receptor subunit TctC